ncbi:MAG TPA: transcriptional repressor [bacterium]
MSNDKKIDLIKNIFHSKGLRFTGQRKVIVTAFLKVKRHINTEDLFLQLRKKFPGIGYATVYRTLKIMKEGGIAKEIDFGDGIKRYENSGSKPEHHDHIVCLKCGSIEEFLELKIEQLQEQIAKRFNFNIVSHKMQIFGYCRKCWKGDRENA